MLTTHQRPGTGQCVYSQRLCDRVQCASLYCINRASDFTAEAHISAATPVHETGREFDLIDGKFDMQLETAHMDFPFISQRLDFAQV